MLHTSIWRCVRPSVALSVGPSVGNQVLLTGQNGGIWWGSDIPFMKIKENKWQRAVHVSQPIPLQSHSRHISCVRGGSCCSYFGFSTTKIFKCFSNAAVAAVKTEVIKLNSIYLIVLHNPHTLLTLEAPQPPQPYSPLPHIMTTFFQR